MYTGILHLHNLLRYVIIILLVWAIVKSFIGWFGKKKYTPTDDKISLFLLISIHLQALLGLILYFISPIVESALSNFGASMKDPILRFWGIEHIASMIIGVTIITMGRARAKNSKTDTAKFKKQAIYFVLAMVLIFSAIPWPWSAISRAWF